MKRLEVDLPQALAFLTRITAPGVFGNLTAIDPLDGRCFGVGFSIATFHRAEAFIKRHSMHNLYWTVNALAREVNGKPRKSDIVQIRYAHLDLDDPSPEALERLGRALPPPTLIIFSGGGYGAFWKVKGPTKITPRTLPRFEALNKHLLTLFGAGAGTWNIDRLMRMPSTVNHLSAKKRAEGRKPAATRLIEHHPERSYTVAQLRAMTVPALVNTSAATTPPRPPGHRRSAKTIPETSATSDGFASHLKPQTQLEYLYARRARAAALAAPRESDKSRSGNLWSIVGYYISMGWSDEYIHTQCAEHPHVLSQKNPERAIQRCIDGQRRKRKEAQQAQVERARKAKNQRPRY